MLEALSCGSPVIVSDVADNLELVEGNRVGCVLDTDDIESCAEKVASLVPHVKELAANAISIAKAFDAYSVVPVLINEMLTS